MALAAGFADPVLDSQRTFRAVLEAFAHPGRIVELAGPAVPPLGAAATAVALTLLDFETPVWLDGKATTEDVVEYLRFHCGAAIVAAPADARFAIVADPDALPPLAAFAAGSDERPDQSATLIVQVRTFSGGRGLRLTGPGIREASRLDVDGTPAWLWPAWTANAEMFPRGIDVILCAGDRAAALPRTTRVEG